MKTKRKFRFEIFKEGQFVSLSIGESFHNIDGDIATVKKYQKKDSSEYLWIDINGHWFAFTNGEKSHGKITNNFEIINE